MARNFNKPSRVSQSKGKFGNKDGAMILTIFVGLIIVVTMMQPIANTIFDRTNTFSVANTTQITSTNNTIVSLDGKVVTGFTAFNATNGTAGFAGLTIGAGNYTLLDNQLVNGEQRATLAINASDGLSNSLWNVSYTFQPEGYVDDSGSRTLTTLILIFAALGALIFVVVVLFKKGSFRKLLGM